MSYRILLLAVLLCLVYPYTDLTMLNCPAQFSITQFNTTASSTAYTLGNLLYSSFPQQPVVDIVTKGDIDALSSQQNQMMLPYILLAVLYLVFYIFTILCCLFDRSCPPSDCLRRDIDS